MRQIDPGPLAEAHLPQVLLHDLVAGAVIAEPELVAELVEHGVARDGQSFGQRDGPVVHRRPVVEDVAGRVDRGRISGRAVIQAIGRGEALFQRGGRHVAGGVDPEDRDARGCVVLEEVAVVARDLDRQAGGGQIARRQDAIDDRPGVLHEGIGRRREIGIVPEQLLGRHGLGDLDEAARRADRQRQREPPLRGIELIRGQKGVGQRLCPEVEHGGELRSAPPAGGGHEAAAPK